MGGCARIGFRLHTGWATLVAIASESEELRVLHRCRLELLPAGAGRFVYHQSAVLPLGEAEKLIDSIRHSAETAARDNLRSAIGHFSVTHACIPTGAARVPGELGAVLKSHALIHAAEGALYAGAAAAACQSLSIPVITVFERDVWRLAAARMKMSEAELKAKIDAIRDTIGAPWTADHKIAAAAAVAHG